MSDSERAHSGVGGLVEISPRGPLGSDRVAFHAYSGGSAYHCLTISSPLLSLPQPLSLVFRLVSYGLARSRSRSPSPQERASLSLTLPLALPCSPSRSPSYSPSLSLALPLASPAPPSYLRGGDFFSGPQSLCRPLASSVLSTPTSMPARLRRQIRYVLQYFIFLINSDLHALSGPRHATPDALSTCTLG